MARSATCRECRKLRLFALMIVQTEEGPARLEECGTCGAIASFALLAES